MNELFEAIKNGQAEQVKGLLYGLQKGPGRASETNRWTSTGRAPVDCNVTDPQTGDTALHMVLLAPNTSLEQLVAKRDIAMLLLSKGIDVTKKNFKGQTALELAQEEHYKQEPVTDAGKPYENMLILAYECFLRYSPIPVAANGPASSTNTHQQPQHDLSTVPMNHSHSQPQR